MKISLDIIDGSNPDQISNMTLGVVKLTRKFEPYNPIIQFFTIEKVSKNALFQT